MHFQRNLPQIHGNLAGMIFRLHAPIILAVLLLLTVNYFQARERSVLLANSLYSDYIEYIFASLCIMLGSMLLGELHERDLKK